MRFEVTKGYRLKLPSSLEYIRMPRLKTNKQKIPLYKLANFFCLVVCFFFFFETGILCVALAVCVGIVRPGYP